MLDIFTAANLSALGKRFDFGGQTVGPRRHLDRPSKNHRLRPRDAAAPMWNSWRVSVSHCPFVARLIRLIRADLKLLSGGSLSTFADFGGWAPKLAFRP